MVLSHDTAHQNYPKESRHVQGGVSRRGGAGSAGTRRSGAAAELQEVLLQRAVGLLCRRDVARLKRLAQTCEQRRDFTLLAGRLRAPAMVMVLMSRACSLSSLLLLNVLLKGREVRLGCGKISGLQVLSQL